MIFRRSPRALQLVSCGVDQLNLTTFRAIDQHVRPGFSGPPTIGPSLFFNVVSESESRFDVASKDLQITRTQSTRLITSPEALATSVGVSAVNPVEIVAGALKRQWLRLLVATLVSTGVAWAIATSFATQKVISRLTLSSQSLPATSQNVYTAPNPNVAAMLLKSPRILQAVVERHNLPPANILARMINPLPNLATSSIEVALVQTDTDKAIAILDDVAGELVKSIASDRKETLTEHAGYICELLVTAKSDLASGRKELARLEESLRLRGADSSQKNAEIYGLANREADLKSSIDECRRKDARLLSDLKLLTEEFAFVQNAAFRAVIEGRRRQSERLGERLTRTAPATAANAEIQRQLHAAEQELADHERASKNPERRERGESGDVPAEGPSARRNRTSRGDGRVSGAGEVMTVGADPNDLNTGVDASELVADQLSKWVERISAIGRDALGELEPATLESAKTSWSKLSTISDEARELQFEANNNRVDLDYFLAKTSELEQEKNRSTNEDVKRSSSELLELKLEVDEKEKRYSELSQQLDQINQLRECELTEYVVTSPAAVNPVDDVSSNRRNLFVCSVLGFGLLLTAPLIAMEVIRLRPSPITVISRRWNLPVLGSHSPGFSGNTSSNGVRSQDLRLMALRIQQSLSRPSGRVVMFCGLDHGESPLDLIRSLSYCLAQREESVLMIQIPPTLEAAEGWRLGNEGSFKAGRPGVAEFLASGSVDATSFVISAGVAGIDFLPGGCSAVASEAMASSRLTGLIEQLRAKYSMIILCGPSTLYPADLQMLAARADGIVFTVNQHSVNSVYGNEVIGDLLELGAPILGLAEQPQSTGSFGSVTEHQNVSNLAVR
jgi:hypothetical protein